MEVIRNFPDSELVANLRSGQRMDETIKAIYNLAKTIVLVLNAEAILVLMYLAIEWKSFF